jgi:4-amino-4-deoxy-L-arabinose transferase-like glycosyltransferase
LAFCLLIGAVVWVLGVPAWGGPGLTWDEAYYYPTFRDVGSWTALLLSDPSAALSAEGIQVGWSRINELPPVTKWLGAFCASLPMEGWWRLAAIRIYPALAFAGTLFLLLRIGNRVLPRGLAALPMLLYLSQPVVLGHAQIAATETVFIFLTVLALRLALVESHRSRLLLLGVAGLALATKVNGLILLTALSTWLIGRHLLCRNWSGGGGPQRPVGRLGLDLAFAVLLPIIAAVVALSIWPWMWNETLARLIGYWRFITEHSHQGLWFWGQKWNFDGAPAPVWYPLAILHLTTPLPVVILLWAGLIGVVLRAVRARRIHSVDLLFFLAIMGPLAASSLPNAPKYDSTRLFLPMIAPACLLAARGLAVLLVQVRTKWRRWTPFILFLAIPILLLYPPKIDFYQAGVLAIKREDPVFPFEQTWWGNAMNREVVEELNRRLPPNGSVRPMAMQGLTFGLLQEWGLLRADLRFDADPPYDAHLIQNRRGFWGRSEWTMYTTREPLATFGEGARGEALLYLYDGRPPGS